MFVNLIARDLGIIIYREIYDRLISWTTIFIALGESPLYVAHAWH